MFPYCFMDDLCPPPHVGSAREDNIRISSLLSYSFPREKQLICFQRVSYPLGHIPHRQSYQQEPCSVFSTQVSQERSGLHLCCFRSGVVCIVVMHTIKTCALPDSPFCPTWTQETGLKLPCRWLVKCLGIHFINSIIQTEHLILGMGVGKPQILVSFYELNSLGTSEF